MDAQHVTMSYVFPSVLVIVLHDEQTNSKLQKNTVHEPCVGIVWFEIYLDCNATHTSSYTVATNKSQ